MSLRDAAQATVQPLTADRESVLHSNVAGRGSPPAGPAHQASADRSGIWLIGVRSPTTRCAPTDQPLEGPACPPPLPRRAVAAYQGGTTIMTKLGLALPHLWVWSEPGGHHRHRGGRGTPRPGIGVDVRTADAPDRRRYAGRRWRRRAAAGGLRLRVRPGRDAGVRRRADHGDHARDKRPRSSCASTPSPRRPRRSTASDPSLAGAGHHARHPPPTRS
jgi:hypothetical protein